MKKFTNALTYIKTHGLRHTYVSIALEAGTPMYEVDKTVDHRDTKMIMAVYYSINKKRKIQSTIQLTNYLNN